MAYFDNRFPKTKKEKRKKRKITKLKSKASFAKKTGNVRKSLRLDRRLARKGVIRSGFNIT